MERQKSEITLANKHKFGPSCDLSPRHDRT